MKKYIIPFLASFLIVGVASAFTPATLFLETWNGIKRLPVYTQEQADKLFKNDWQLEKQPPMLGGVAYTTISGSDTMKNFPTTYNANNALFDSGKIDVGTTSVASITALVNLATVGTITSGVWSGTAITVAKGGTGTTSPTSNYVMLGDGSNGLKVVAGQGTSGQSLVSTGASSAPTWQTPAVDQAADYTWTGTHTFNGNTNSGLVGEIKAYASSTVPTGWLSCNGATVSKTTYATLFALVGFTYGADPGSGNFILPDLRGRNILMASSTPNMGQTGGESNHTMTEAELKAHTHSLDANIAGSGSGGHYSSGGSYGSGGSPTTGSTGSTVPFNVLDPYLVLNYIIKF